MTVSEIDTHQKTKILNIVILDCTYTTGLNWNINSHVETCLSLSVVTSWRLKTENNTLFQSK